MRYEREVEHEITIPIEEQGVTLKGNLYLPENAEGLVLFAHGSGSSRLSPRNRFVAQYLNKGSIGTLLFDLLTRSEEVSDMLTANLRFNIDLLGKRLNGATDWVKSIPELSKYAIGYFGASTGAAAALVAATVQSDIKAIATRGGRPDMAGTALPNVTAPTLLIVGGNDHAVINLNREAYKELGAEVKQMEIVPGASHLFEEPGTLEEAARLSVDWFIRYLH
jgi:putative phosphoribosyl transferase